MALTGGARRRRRGLSGRARYLPRCGLLATALRLRALHRAGDIGSALKRGVNVCQRQLVNEVLGPLVTELVRNFGREAATPIQNPVPMPAPEWPLVLNYAPDR